VARLALSTKSNRRSWAVSHAVAASRPRNLLRAAPYAAFGLLSLNVLAWFHRGLPIGYGDSGVFQFFLHPGYLLDLYRWTWNPNSLGGYPAPQQLTMLPLTMFFYLLSSLGLSAGASQAAWYWLIEFGAMTSMYLLLVRLGNGDSSWRMASLVGAIVYVFNPLTMEAYWYAGFLSVSAILFLPMILLLLEYSLDLNAAGIALGTAAVLLVNAAAFENPAFAVPICALGAVFLAVRLSRYPPTAMGRRLVRISLGVGLGAAANAWWILPLIRGASNFLAIAAALEDPTSTLQTASAETDLGSLLRMLAYRSDAPLWAYKEPMWRFTYGRWYMWAITGVIWGLLIVAIYQRPWRRFTGLFLSVATVSLLLSLGSGPPFGQVYLWLFNHLAYFRAFRFPSTKFGLILAFGFAGLITLGTVAILRHRLAGRERGWIGWTLILAFIALVPGAYVYPMWTGSVANGVVTIRGIPITAEVSVPHAYEALDTFLNEQAGAYQLLALPLRDGTTVTLGWAHGYDGPDATWLLLEHPTLSYLAGAESMDSLQLAASQSSAAGVLRVAGMLGARYVLVQKDVVPGSNGFPTSSSDLWASVTEGLLRTGAKQVFDAGQLTLFDIPNNLRRAMVYAPGDIRVVPSWHDWVAETEVGISSSIDAVLSTDLNQVSSLLSSSINRPTALRVTQENPTRWVIDVKDAQGPFMLTLNQSFDAGWKATLLAASSASSSDIGSVDGPVRVNDFGNGWLIHPSLSARNHDFRVVLEYQPQGDVVLGVWIAAGSLGALLVLMLVARFWPRRRKASLSRVERVPGTAQEDTSSKRRPREPLP
jgi:hypothetical protein